MTEPALEQVRVSPDYKVFINRSELQTDVAVDVLDVSVCTYATGASWFCVTMSNWHSDKQEFKYSDGPLFKEGAKLDVTLGYDARVVRLIKGEVTALEPEFNQDE